MENKYTHIDLFSGIGGFSLAFDNIFNEQENNHIFVEIDPFCQAVLRKHWPEAEIHGDIRAFDGGESEPFLLTGGFPCQPFSQAGKRKGTEDNRHLWPDMLRVIQVTKPEWVIAENVRGLLSIEGGVVFEQVCLDLEANGYEVQPIVIPAVAVNAPTITFLALFLRFVSIFKKYFFLRYFIKLFNSWTTLIAFVMMFGF